MPPIKNKIKKLTCKVQSIDYLNNDTVQVFLKIQSAKSLQYIAGQYIDLIHTSFVTRSYSIANNISPYIKLIELHIRLIDGGKFTQVLFDSLGENSKFQIKGPKGDCYLKQESKKPVILVAGGVGFAPIKSIIEDAIAINAERQIYLYWGVRDEAGLYMDLPQQWAEEHDNIHFTPVLSDSNDAWQGRTGLVHESILTDFDDLIDYEVYAYGPPAMVKSLARNLFNQGLIQDNFFSDFSELKKEFALIEKFGT